MLLSTVKHYGVSSTLHVFNCFAEDKRAAIFLSQPLQQAKLKMPLTHVSGASREWGHGAHLPRLAPAPYLHPRAPLMSRP